MEAEIINKEFYIQRSFSIAKTLLLAIVKTTILEFFIGKTMVLASHLQFCLYIFRSGLLSTRCENLALFILATQVLLQTVKTRVRVSTVC